MTGLDQSMTPAPVSRRWLRTVAVLLLVGTSVSAQPGWRNPPRDDEGEDGRFRFVRLRWDSGMSFGRRGMSNAWNHDYPRAEINLARILRELTLIDVNPDGRSISRTRPTRSASTTWFMG